MVLACKPSLSNPGSLRVAHSFYFQRGQVPPSVLNASNAPGSTLWLDDWGTPSANFPSTPSCNISDFFGPQKLVLDITLCGIW